MVPRTKGKNWAREWKPPGEILVDPLELDNYPSEVDVEAEFSQRELQRQIARALCALRPREALVLVQLFFAEKTCAELAALLDRSPGRIGQIREVALRKLRRGLLRGQLRHWALEDNGVYLLSPAERATLAADLEDVSEHMTALGTSTWNGGLLISRERYHRVLGRFSDTRRLECRNKHVWGCQCSRIRLDFSDQSPHDPRSKEGI